jgi:ryanodine receptor 2
LNNREGAEKLLKSDSDKAPSSTSPNSNRNSNNNQEAHTDETSHDENPVNNSSSSSINHKKILSTLARNFYRLKYLALILAFLINFCMLFYKARVLNDEGPGNELMNSDLEEEAIEVIMMDPDEYYIEHILKGLAFVHSLVAFGVMVAYYVLKVPLVIFKREKEIARKLEFQGLWIAEQPSDDDMRSHWDKMVISTKTYPELYWHKFVKKNVKAKYAEQFDVQQLCNLLGISIDSDEYKIDNSNKSNSKDKESGGILAR